MIGGVGVGKAPVELGGMGMNGAPGSAPPLLDTPPCQAGIQRTGWAQTWHCFMGGSQGNPIIHWRGNGASAVGT